MALAGSKLSHRFPHPGGTAAPMQPDDLLLLKFTAPNFIDCSRMKDNSIKVFEISFALAYASTCPSCTKLDCAELRML